MPSKGRQRASRQAQLRKSSKKSSKRNKPAIDSKLADPLTSVKPVSYTHLTLPTKA